FTVSEWDLSPAVDFRARRLEAKAQRLASRHLVEQGEAVRMTRLTAASAYHLWEESRKAAPLAGPGEGPGSAAWHEREAAWSEAARRWAAARFHLNQALPDAEALTHEQEAQRARLLARIAVIEARLLGEQGKWKEAAQSCEAAMQRYPKDVPL